jgi:serine/threonine-protein kinase
MASADYDPPAGALIPPGTRIEGGYTILQHLQNGGMGELYLGEERLSRKQVAIKAIRQDLAARPEIKEAFIDEAIRLQDLRHEGIVSYRNAVDDEALGRVFMVMEFIEGRSLKDHLEQVGPLHAENVRLMLKRLCPALARAHASKIIHRDLSPDNVMLRGGKVSDPVLIDFGISKTIDPTDATRNVERRFVGKFKYVSPEQCGLFGGVVGPRADIYGLGLMIARALHHEALPMGTDLKEARAARQQVPNLDHLPADLQPLLRYMLQPAPDDRPPSMLHVEQMAMNPLSVPAAFGGTGLLGDDDATRFDDEELDLDAGPGGNPPGSIPPGSVPPGGIVAPQDWSVPDGGSLPPGAAPVEPGAPVDGLQVPTGFDRPGPDTGGRTGGRRGDGETDDETGGGAMKWLLAGALVAAVGAGAYFLLPNVLDPDAPDGPVAPGEVTPGGDVPPSGSADLPPLDRLAGLFPPQGTVRAGVLADSTEGPCRYASRLQTGLDRGKIALYAQDPDRGFDLALTTFAAAFDDRPATVARPVTEAQCPVLDFARAVQGRGAQDPSLVPITTEIDASEPVLALRLSRTLGRPVLFLAVDPEGRAYNLARSLVEETASERRYALDFGGFDYAEPMPFLLVAVASNASLVSAAAIPAQGAPVAGLLDALAEELVEQAVPVGFALQYVTYGAE